MIFDVTRPSPQNHAQMTPRGNSSALMAVAILISSDWMSSIRWFLDEKKFVTSNSSSDWSCLSRLPPLLMIPRDLFTKYMAFTKLLIWKASADETAYFFSVFAAVSIKLSSGGFEEN
jgi:hypothetical protein